MPPKKVRGKGIKQSVDARLNKRPKAITEYLKKHGNELIKQIIVCRSPLSSAFSMIGNLLTNGGWDENKQKLGYDDIFQLYELVKLDKSTIRIEKNSRVEISNKTNLGQDYKIINDIDITLNELFDRMESACTDTTRFRQIVSNLLLIYCMLLLEKLIRIILQSRMHVL